MKKNYPFSKNLNNLFATKKYNAKKYIKYDDLFPVVTSYDK
jgi:hypothetical protein